MVRWTLILLVLASPVWGQGAADRPARELLIEASVTLLAEPANSREPGKVRVLEVLRGAGVRRGDLLDASAILPALGDEASPDWASLGQVLLFGALAEKPDGPFRLLPTGLRLVTQSDRCWIAITRSTGGFRLVQNPALGWDPLVTQLRADARNLAVLEALQKQPASSQRSRELIIWMQRHPPARPAPRSPFQGRELPTDVGETGWGNLATAPLRWVLQSGNAEDSWEALRVHARQHDGAVSGSDLHPFATPQGRALLLGRARDEHALDGDALRALKVLTWEETYPTEAVPTAPFAKPLSETEQATLIRGVLPFLTRKEPRWKQGAAQALVSLVRAVKKTPEDLRQEVARSLETQLKDAGPGVTRNVLAEAALRQNPQGRGPLALLLDLDRRDAKLHFWLGVYPEGGVVSEVPTLVIEEIAKDGKATEVEKKPLPCVVPPDWKAGWDTRKPLFVEVPFPKLKSGATYRLTVTGAVGVEKTKFSSEPRTFQAVGPMQPWTPSTGKIVFDEE